MHAVVKGTRKVYTELPEEKQATPPATPTPPPPPPSRPPVSKEEKFFSKTVVAFMKREWLISHNYYNLTEFFMRIKAGLY